VQINSEMKCLNHVCNEPVLSMAMKQNKTILTDERFHKIYVNDQLKEQTKSYRSNVVLKEVEK
jgi:hypothetical protein